MAFVEQRFTCGCYLGNGLLCIHDQTSTTMYGTSKTRLNTGTNPSWCFGEYWYSWFFEISLPWYLSFTIFMFKKPSFTLNLHFFLWSPIFKLTIFIHDVFTTVIFQILRFFTRKNPNFQSSIIQVPVPLPHYNYI